MTSHKHTHTFTSLSTRNPQELPKKLQYTKKKLHVQYSSGSTLLSFDIDSESTLSAPMRYLPILGPQPRMMPGPQLDFSSCFWVPITDSCQIFLRQMDLIFYFKTKNAYGIKLHDVDLQVLGVNYFQPKFIV